ncbi:unnamed protein product [Acanthoscelides obtectus]|uniref:Uncharacterized protein n=1 Tax=Acanthoscelides obtectus TaxID=200917 RepID=A0A9P0QGR7_ACAOB|nr:unnamed protein product [Acanthoscelides obtectus]CAK1682446.1 hypothetical protein AOBTE_LOCUS33635 [Acanthoscelides obtectus]
MAASYSFASLGELYDEPSEDEVLARLKIAAAGFLPEGWKDWRVRKDHVVHMEPSVLNKMRFCLSALEIAKAFNPDAKCLKERPYRDMKVKMMSWPFCVGLILGPPSLALQVRGSALHCELVTQSVKNLRGLLMTRKEASKLLGDGSETDESESCSQSTSKQRVSTTSRLKCLEAESAATRSLLQEILSRLDRKGNDTGDSDLEEDQAEEFMEEVESERESDAGSTPWRAPEVVLQLANGR